MREHMWLPAEARRGCQIPGIGDTGNYWLPYGQWESNTEPAEEQQTSLNAEHPLQPQY